MGEFNFEICSASVKCLSVFRALFGRTLILEISFDALQWQLPIVYIDAMVLTLNINLYLIATRFIETQHSFGHIQGFDFPHLELFSKFRALILVEPDSFM